MFVMVRWQAADDLAYFLSIFVNAICGPLKLENLLFVALLMELQEIDKPKPHTLLIKSTLRDQLNK